MERLPAAALALAISSVVEQGRDHGHVVVVAGLSVESGHDLHGHRREVHDSDVELAPAPLRWSR
jgi:hypothetical protein